MRWKKNARAATVLAAIALVAGCGGTPAVSGPKTDTGQLGGAPYRVDIPANWNGELVMLLHGYEPQGMPRESPWPRNEMTPVFLARGYAVAASAYSSQGWSVEQAVPENETLRAHFVERYGAPSRTYLVGVSLGGSIALASLEQHGDAYSGALTMCGVNLPATTAFDDGIVTPLVAFDYLYPKALGLAAGGLADPDSPPMVDPEAIEASLKTNEGAATSLAARLEVPRPALAGSLMLDYLVLREMQARAGGFPVDNRATAYAGFGDDAAFNKGVRRYSGDPGAMRYLDERSNLTGRIGKPLVIQPNNDDPTVPKRFNAVYPGLAKTAGKADELVVLPPVGAGHCDFTAEQTTAAFAALTDWVEKGRKPSDSRDAGTL